MKKGRHRRFEEARKLKQAGPSAFDLGFGGSDQRRQLEQRLRERAAQFAADKQLAPSRQEMVDQLNRTVATFARAGGPAIQFE